MELPSRYAWLDLEPGPLVLRSALSLYGTEEVVGDSDNPEILRWAEELGIKRYVHDSIAWCGLFAAIAVKRAGYAPVKDPLWAANWSKWGNPAGTPMLGDVLVFSRPGGNHVGFYIGEDEDTFHVLGGNQSDAVCIKRIAKSRLTSARRSPWKIAQPANVRRVVLDARGEISKNEA